MKNVGSTWKLEALFISSITKKERMNIELVLPSSGGSRNRSIALMSESFTPSTLKSPPWTTKILLFIKWARGKQQNTSAKSSTNMSVNLDLTSPSKPYILFMLLLSWFPRARYMAEILENLISCSLYLIINTIKDQYEINIIKDTWMQRNWTCI